MTQEEIDAKIAELRAKYVDPAIHYGADRWPWVKAHWRELLIGVLVLAVLVFAWRWRVQSSEAERLGKIVTIGASIAESQSRLDALDREANERRQQIKAKLEQLADADARLDAKRKELAKASAARVSQIPKDAAGVAAELTKLGFPAKPVEAK